MIYSKREGRRKKERFEWEYFGYTMKENNGDTSHMKKVRKANSAMGKVCIGHRREVIRKKYETI